MTEPTWTRCEHCNGTHAEHSTTCVTGSAMVQRLGLLISSGVVKGDEELTREKVDEILFGKRST